MNGRRILSRRAVCLPMLIAMFFAPAGCKLFAVGEVHQIVVAIPSELRDALGADLRSALEPRIPTTRGERVFDIAYVDSNDPEWYRLRLVRHILLIGTADDNLIAEALAGSRRASRTEAPAVIQVNDVWAKRQTVTIALLEPEENLQSVRELLALSGRIYFEQFEELIDARATLTGMSTTASKRFRRDVGFTFVLPKRFEHEEPEPGLYLFKDEDPNPAAPVIRTIVVESRPPHEVEWSPRTARAWRETLARKVTYPPPVTADVSSAVQGVRLGRRVMELRGTWTNPQEEWPAAGPFITQLVECPDRMYLIDASLYAPASEKYELIAQLELILGTFQCTGAPAAAA